MTLITDMSNWRDGFREKMKLKLCNRKISYAGLTINPPMKYKCYLLNSYIILMDVENDVHYLLTAQKNNFKLILEL